jgi:hypothetical protein
MASYRRAAQAAPQPLPPISYTTTVEVCGHRVAVWFDLLMLENVTLDAQLESELRERAEERAGELIPEGYVCGQLCAHVETDDGESDADVYGSWSIEREEN